MAAKSVLSSVARWKLLLRAAMRPLIAMARSVPVGEPSRDPVTQAGMRGERRSTRP
jgi:hypothetical protein